MASVNVWRAAGVSVFAMLAAAVGCTPVPRHLLAVERTDVGQAHVLIAPCPEYDARQFIVSASGGNAGTQKWMISNYATSGTLDAVDLFMVPSGWNIDMSTLTDLRGGYHYDVFLSGAVRGRGLDGGLSFSRSEFEALKSGEVLTMGDEDTEVVSRSAFLKKDDRRCAPG